MIGSVFAVRFVGEPFADLGQSVLTSGSVKVGSEFGAFVYQMTAPAQQVSGGPHLGGVDIRLGQHPATSQYGNLLGVDFIVLGVAARKGFHRERMA